MHMDKLIHDDKGSVTILNDCTTIMKLLGIVHPSVQILVGIAKSQDSEVGDGTMMVVLLAAAFLREAKRRGSDHRRHGVGHSCHSFSTCKPKNHHSWQVNYVLGGVARNVAKCMSKLGTKPHMIGTVGLDMADKNYVGSGVGIWRQKDIDTAVVCNILDANGEVAAGVASVEAIEKFLTPEWILLFNCNMSFAPVVMVDTNLSPPAWELLVKWQLNVIYLCGLNLYQLLNPGEFLVVNLLLLKLYPAVESVDGHIRRHAAGYSLPLLNFD
ncbi:T-complex protein 1 subunit eta [Melia azedarach]|uniref:T-complex protein 1 subunit eta n=1 Tax=Melia azedarach TaxID=155640 RepID=A0ACC1YJB4_MELAZ|nr:T-complex protein 1 subunit eta [Melia azedarach]